MDDWTDYQGPQGVDFKDTAYTIDWTLGKTAITVEQLYQAFKKRLAEEAKTDPDDFPLGPACDLSGEGKCEACE